MKKISLLFTLAFLAFSASLLGQENDNVTLNVRIHPIQSIIVNPTQKIVDIDYKTVEDYKNGVTTTQPNHLTVYSVGGYAVKVESNGDLTGTAGTIVSSDIKINAEKGTGTTDLNVNKDVELGTTGKVLFSKSSSANDENITVSYTAAGKNAYINKYIDGEDPTVYTASITYTIEAM